MTNRIRCRYQPGMEEYTFERRTYKSGSRAAIKTEAVRWPDRWAEESDWGKADDTLWAWQDKIEIVERGDLETRAERRKNRKKIRRLERRAWRLAMRALRNGEGGAYWSADGDAGEFDVWRGGDE